MPSPSARVKDTAIFFDRASLAIIIGKVYASASTLEAHVILIPASYRFNFIRSVTRNSLRD